MLALYGRIGELRALGVDGTIVGRLEQDVALLDEAVTELQVALQAAGATLDMARMRLGTLPLE